MTPAKIKKIREKLNLTQDELATILGVTKMTVWRYEDGRATPSDEAIVKLTNLEASLNNPAERKHLKGLRKTPGGVAAITAIAAMGTAMFSGAAAAGAAAAGCAGIVASPAGKSLFGFLQALLGRQDPEKATEGRASLAVLGGGVVAAGAAGVVTCGAIAKPAGKAKDEKKEDEGQTNSPDPGNTNAHEGGIYEI